MKQHGKQPSAAALSFVTRGAAVTGGAFSGYERVMECNSIFDGDTLNVY